MTSFYNITRHKCGLYPRRHFCTKLASRCLKLSTHACLAQLDQHQTCKPVMVSVVSSSPTGGNFNFLRHVNANFAQKCQKCQICVIYKNLGCIFSIFFLCTLMILGMYLYKMHRVVDALFFSLTLHTASLPQSFVAILVRMTLSPE